MAKDAKRPEGNPANRRVDGPEALRERRREPDPDAATRLSVDKARVGGELSADPLPYDETETAEALKRTAESDRRT
jgi:hypothetical protein